MWQSLINKYKYLVAVNVLTYFLSFSTVHVIHCLCCRLSALKKNL